MISMIVKISNLTYLQGAGDILVLTITLKKIFKNKVLIQ